MIERTEQRKIRKSGNVFEVTLKDREPMSFRVPSPTKMEHILARMTSDDMRDLAKAAKEGDAADAAANIQGSMSTMCGLIGAAVGVSWHAEGLDLEAAWDGSADTLDAYGVAVFDEMWDFGFTFADVFTIWVACFGRISDVFVAQKTLMERAGFFKQPEANSTTSSSTSESSTSETPTAGGA